MGDICVDYDLASFQSAIDRLRKAGVQQTTTKRSVWLSQLTGGDVFLKFENLQEGNSFKLRGATNFLYAFKDEKGEFPKTVITASGGNHGMAVAVACSKLKIRCIVIIPSNSITPNKLYLLQDCYGAEVLVQGTCFHEAHEIGVAMAEKDEFSCYIHPYLHPWVMQGAGTMMLELNEQITEGIDIIVSTLGGGGMQGGLITAAKALGVKDKISFVSVETEGADYYYQSHTQGKLIHLPKITSIASTLGASTGSLATFQLFEDNIDFPVLVSDAEAVDALWKVLEKERILVEPSCSASFAALLKYPEYFANKRVVVIVCGGNVSYDECVKWKEQFLSTK